MRRVRREVSSIAEDIGADLRQLSRDNERALWRLQQEVSVTGCDRVYRGRGEGGLDGSRERGEGQNGWGSGAAGMGQTGCSVPRAPAPVGVDIGVGMHCVAHNGWSCDNPLQSTALAIACHCARQGEAAARRLAPVVEDTARTLEASAAQLERSAHRGRAALDRQLQAPRGGSE